MWHSEDWSKLPHKGNKSYPVGEIEVPPRISFQVKVWLMFKFSLQFRGCTIFIKQMHKHVKKLASGKKSKANLL